MAPELAKARQIPVVDGPVVALAFASIMPNELEDALKAEDKRAELTLWKAHQAAALAVKASTSASFFNRTSLLWLQQVQERVPAEYLCTHQDINKLMAAAEFSAMPN